jgi:hypothetical protein
VGAWWNLDRERAVQTDADLDSTVPDRNVLPWDVEDDTKGWDRLSLTWQRSKPPPPNVQTADLIMPSGLGTPRMIWRCFLMALIVTALYVWCPLYLVNFFVAISDRLYAGIMAGSPVVLTLLLYFCGVRETKRDRELAARL